MMHDNGRCERRTSGQNSLSEVEYTKNVLARQGESTDQGVPSVRVRGAVDLVESSLRPAGILPKIS